MLYSRRNRPPFVSRIANKNLESFGLSVLSFDDVRKVQEEVREQRDKEREQRGKPSNNIGMKVQRQQTKEDVSRYINLFSIDDIQAPEVEDKLPQYDTGAPCNDELEWNMDLIDEALSGEEDSDVEPITPIVLNNLEDVASLMKKDRIEYLKDIHVVTGGIMAYLYSSTASTVSIGLVRLDTVQVNEQINLCYKV